MITAINDKAGEISQAIDNATTVGGKLFGLVGNIWWILLIAAGAAAIWYFAKRIKEQRLEDAKNDKLLEDYVSEKS